MRVGVDVGGTFTDVVGANQEEWFRAKVPTTPDDPVVGVLHGLKTILDQAGVEISGLKEFSNGSTIGLNTLLQRSGVRLALLTTRGFRSLLEIQRLRLGDPVSMHARRPVPLIPRRDVFEIDERIRADGTVYAPLNKTLLTETVKELADRGYDGVVVCFLHSYVNPAHELMVREAIEETHPHLHTTLSHEVWPEMREYERALVAIINAYTRDAVLTYCDRLEMGVQAAPLDNGLYMSRSNGGVAPLNVARRRPIDSLLSGPAAGVVGAAHVARASGHENLLTLDMGGTSTDIAVVLEGEPTQTTEQHVGEFPIMVPMIGVSSIGAGGGSMAWLDSAGLLKVGPESAGASPGPACYGLGGTTPTLTDAYLVTGFISERSVKDGRIPLSLDLAVSSMEKLAVELKCDTDDAATAIVEVALHNLRAEVSRTLIAMGVSPEDLTLVAYGGAGPIQANALAREFGIPRILVPRNAGELCALGCLVADIRTDYSQPCDVELDSDGMRVLSTIFDRLRSGATGSTVESVEGPADYRCQINARYKYQAYDIELIVEPEDLRSERAEAIAAQFHQAHESLYRYSDPTVPVVARSVQLKVTRQRADLIPLDGPTATGKSPDPVERRRLLALGQSYDSVPAYDISALEPGFRTIGPATIDLGTSSCVILPGSAANVDEYGNIVIEDVKTGGDR